MKKGKVSKSRNEKVIKELAREFRIMLSEINNKLDHIIQRFQDLYFYCGDGIGGI